MSGTQKAFCDCPLKQACSATSASRSTSGMRPAGRPCAPPNQRFWYSTRSSRARRHQETDHVALVFESNGAMGRHIIHNS
jgi:hypothetical protein